MIPKPNEQAQHKCCFWIEAIAYELLPSGECSGIPIEKRKVMLEITGQDKFILLRKMNEFLEEMKQCSEQK